MISLFFAHLMKTGGSSLIATMRRAVGEGRVFPDEDLPVGLAAQKSIPSTLLGTDEEYRASLRFCSVHQPAWVAFEVPVGPVVRVTVLRDPIDRTVSHLRQIARRTRFEGSLEALYEDPVWRSRLANYQTQMLFQRERPPVSPPAVDLDPTALSDAERRQLLLDLQPMLSSGIAQPVEVTGQMLTEAKRTLDRFDVVGTTDRIDVFARRVGAAAELHINQPPHVNRSSDRRDVSATTRRMIEEDNRHDADLVEYARLLEA